MMSNTRPLEITDFLARTGWDNAELTPLAADFSPRRYARLTKPDGTCAILMDADAAQKTPEFVALAKLLRRTGLHAPEIYAAHATQGLVLMENLAGDTFGTLLDQHQAEPTALYRRATAILVTLHKNWAQVAEDPANHDFIASLPRFDAALLTTQAELYLDAAVPYLQQRNVTPDERAAFRNAWQTILAPLANLPTTLILRDYMPDNIIACSAPCADPRDAVLDFQDAGLGCIAYDLASLCEVVRRDGGEAMLPLVLDTYWQQAKPACTQAQLDDACLILSAQRHLRVLGILAQQIQQGRTDKRAMMSRVQQRLAELGRHQCLSAVLNSPFTKES